MVTIIMTYLSQRVPLHDSSCSKRNGTSRTSAGNAASWRVCTMVASAGAMTSFWSSPGRVPPYQPGCNQVDIAGWRDVQFFFGGLEVEVC
eukprot:2622767-Rhodomonas_salina.1